MLAKRLIACLDMDGGRVVKGIRFRGLRDAGDPVELARDYYLQGIDEIVFLDVGASPQSRNILIDVVERVSSQIFIPLTVGGGLRSVEDMRRVLRAGADKVAVCTAALENPALIAAAAEAFGCQCVVVSIDARRSGGSWFAYARGGRQKTAWHALEWAREAERLGAGEILLNSIDRDGTRGGFDLELTARVSEGARVPVIASGGGGTPRQLAAALGRGKADAVLVASILHFRRQSVAGIKKSLRQMGVHVR